MHLWLSCLVCFVTDAFVDLCAACSLYCSVSRLCSFFWQPGGWAAPFPRHYPGWLVSCGADSSSGAVMQALPAWAESAACLPLPCPASWCPAEHTNFLSLELSLRVLSSKQLLLPLKALVVVWWHTQGLGISQIQVKRPCMAVKNLSHKAKSSQFPCQEIFLS